MIWHSILAAARHARTHAIFVSDDQKPDWFHRSKRRALFPRVELVDEYRRASQGRSFHIISFDEFLKRLNADAAVVREVRCETVLTQAAERPRTHRGHYAERAVMRWVQGSGFDTIVENSGGFPDFYAFPSLAESSEGMAVEVKLASSRPLYVLKANDVLARAKQEGLLSEMVVVFVALTEEDAATALNVLQKFFKRRAESISETLIAVGFLNVDGDFRFVGEVLDRPMKQVAQAGA